MSNIKFKKITFSIQLEGDKTKEIDGYLFNIDGLEFDFVVHRSLNDSKLWCVGEYLTGALVSNPYKTFTTRKQAVNDTIKRLAPVVDRLAVLVDEVPHVNEPIKEAIK